MAFALRLRLLPTLAALAMMALTIVLGNWQSARARYKEALQQRLETLAKEPPVSIAAAPVDAAGLDLRAVTARGQWRPEYMVLHDNRVYRGVPGYHVLMPLRLEGSDMHVLVNRGWVAAARDRSVLPAIATPSGTVSVQGMARLPGEKAFELAQDAGTGPVWQTVSIERVRRWSKLDLQTVLIQQDGAMDDGLVRSWERPDMGIDKHRGYALQWYSLAALSLVLLVGLSLRRVPPQTN